MIRQWKAARHKTGSNLRGICIFGTLGMRGVLSLFLAVAVSAGVVHAATPAPTRTALTVSSRQASTQAGSITDTTFTAHVTDSSGKAVSDLAGQGAVSFETDATSLGSAVVDANGDAILVVTSLPVGGDSSTLAVRAVYHPALGSGGTETAALTAGSESAPALVRSAKADASAPPDFTLAINPSSLTVTQGHYGTTTITITPMNGFNEQVTLSCSNLPAQVTCTFSPVIASTANGAFTSTLELQTQAASGALRPPVFEGGSHVALGWLLPGVLVLVGLSTLRRKAGLVSGAGMMLVLIACSVGLSGCSTRYYYNHHPPSVATGTPLGTYTAIKISASGNDGSSVTEHDMTITLQVK